MKNTKHNESPLHPPFIACQVEGQSSENETPTWHGIKTFEWCGHMWIKRPYWGTVHPDDKLNWIDESLPDVAKDGVITLPIKFKECEGRNIARSLVRTTEEFRYGFFTWDVILPEGKYIWPAVWMGSDEGWPPEIDVLEGWSGNDDTYVKRLLFRNIKPTMHWSENADEKSGKHLQETKNNVLRWFIKPGKVNRLECVWSPKYVDIYYNGWKIKRFDDPEMLSHFNKDGYRMHAIMSMSVYGKYWEEKAAQGVFGDISPEFQILSFNYSPIA